MAYQERNGILIPVGHDTDTPPEVLEIDFGEGSRVSMPYNQKRQTNFARLHPDANGTYRLSRVDSKTLLNRPVKDTMKILAKSAASMSDAFDLYRQYLNAGHDWDCESTADELRLQNMEDRITSGGTSTQTILNKFAYGMIIEGAVCGEATGNMVDGITQIDAVSPFEITFAEETDPRRGVITLIGQGVGKNFKVLQDPRTPNPYFIYDPVVSDNKDPWGAIPFLPGISAEIMQSELFTKTDQYLDGQIFPKGYFSFDIASLQRAGLQPQTIVNWVNESLTALRGNMSNADPSQAVVSKVPVLWTLVGSLGKVNLDGLKMLYEMIGNNLNRAYKVPSFIFEGAGSSGLNSSRERTQMLLWLRRIRNLQRMLAEAFTKWGNLELRLQGSRGQCEFILDDTDLEGERLIAEVDKLAADAYKANMEADTIAINNGVITREESRETLVGQSGRFATLDPNRMPPEPQQQPTDNEPEDEDTE